MEPSLDTWTLVFLVVSVHGICLAAILSFKKGRPNLYLSAVLFCFSIILIFYVSYWTRYLTLMPRWVAVVQGLNYLIGPFFYSFIVTDADKRFSLYHLTPFFGYIIYFFSLPVLEPTIRPAVVVTQVVIQSIHLMGYAVVSWVAARRLSGKWEVYLSVMFTGYACNFLIYYMLVWTSTIELQYDYMISFASSVFIFFIGYKGHLIVKNSRAASKYDRSGLTDKAAAEILASVKSLMSEDRLYKNSELKLSDIAEKLSISQNYISQVINDLEGCNYSDFVNRYRIEEAKKLIQKEDLKMIQVAYRVGFNNKVTFNSAFKKFTGLSPSGFKKAVVLQLPELQ